jgi:hypothetical protein
MFRNIRTLAAAILTAAAAPAALADTLKPVTATPAKPIHHVNNAVQPSPAHHAPGQTISGGAPKHKIQQPVQQPSQPLTKPSTTAGNVSGTTWKPGNNTVVVNSQPAPGSGSSSSTTLKTVSTGTPTWQPTNGSSQGKQANGNNKPSPANNGVVSSKPSSGNGSKPQLITGGNPGSGSATTTQGYPSGTNIWKPTKVTVVINQSGYPKPPVVPVASGVVAVAPGAPVYTTPGVPVVQTSPVIPGMPASTVKPVESTPAPESTSPETAENSETPMTADSDAVYGVVLTTVLDGAAATAKLKQNDVVMSLGGMRTESPDDLAVASKKFAGQKVTAVILDGETGEEQQVSITPSPEGTLGIYAIQVRVK